nr:JmjC domain-containing protein [Tanacetum cinerariifolium]
KVAKEQEREIKASAEQSTPRQAELDMIALNLTNEEWIGLVDQVRANPTLSAELLGADVSKDTFSVRMVELMNQRRKAIAEIKAKAKRDKPLTLAQQKEYMRAFVKNQSTTVYTTGWTWKDNFQKLHLFLLVPLAAGDPIFVVPSVSAVPSVSDVPSVSAASSIPAETPIAAGVSTTTGRADLMVLYGMVSDKYKLERATGIGLGLWSDLRMLITAREDRDASIIWDDQDQWEIRSWRFYALPAIHVLETEAGDIMYMFVDKKYPILPTTIQRMKFEV